VKEYLGAPVREDTERLKKVVEEQQRLLRERDEEIAQLKQQIAALQANSGAI
jgi:septal ring factor EnvC (AmiA/AmiB activator)